MICTENCRASVTCATCGLTKKPVGRDLADAANGGMCDMECEGYRQAPYPGHLWPSEPLVPAIIDEDQPDGGQ